MAWGRLATKTLTSAGTSITTDSITTKKFNQILSHGLQNGGTVVGIILLNNDTGSNYARRWSGNGGADGTESSVTSVEYGAAGAAYDEFTCIYMTDISSQERLFIVFTITPSTAGAGTAPTRIEVVAKYTPTTSITEIRAKTGTANSWAIDSNLMVLGTD